MPKTPPQCPMDSILRLLMGPWTTYIIWVLSDKGPQRFGALRRSVPGISTRMLTERLRMLEGAGIKHHKTKLQMSDEMRRKFRYTNLWRLFTRQAAREGQ